MEAIIISILFWSALTFGAAFLLRLIALVFAAWQYEGSAEQIIHNIEGKNKNYFPHIMKSLAIVIVCIIIIISVLSS